MNRRAYLAAVGSGAAVGLAGCTALADVSERVFGSEDYDIGMSRMDFHPEEYETTVGETVVWMNTSELDHTVTALERSLSEGAEYFASGGYEDEETAIDAWHSHFGGRIGPRESYEHTFDVAGTYQYICEPHIKNGDMSGTIVVTE